MILFFSILFKVQVSNRIINYVLFPDGLESKFILHFFVKRQWKIFQNPNEKFILQVSKSIAANREKAS